MKFNYNYKILFLIALLVVLSSIVNPIQTFASSISTGSKEINIKSMGAVGDGITDNTKVIQKAIDGANNYDFIYLPAGKYKVGELEINNKHYLKIAGEGTLIGDSSKVSSAMFYIHDSSHVTIEDINMIGSGKGQSDRGIWSSNNFNLKIQNVNLSNFAQQAIMLWGTSSTEECINRIQNNYISKSGYGIQLMTNAEYYSIMQNTITLCTYGIYGGLGNDRIDNNQISNNVYGIWLDGSIQKNADHSSISNNQINHNRAIGLYLANVHQSESILGNEILSTVGPEVWSVNGQNYSLIIINCKNLVFTSNQIDTGSDGNIYVDGNTGSRFIGNTFYGNIKEVSPSGKNIYMGNIFENDRKLLLHPQSQKPVRNGDIENGEYKNN